MKITPIMINTVIFTGLILGIAFFYGDIQTQYSLTNGTAEAEFDVFNKTYTELDERMNLLQNHTVGFYRKGLTDPSAYYDAVMAFIDVGSVILLMPGILVTFVSETTNFIPGVPNWVIFTFGTIITVIFTLKVAEIVLKRESL